MFLAKYTIDDKEEFAIYCDDINGWDAFHSDTFSPYTKDLMILKLQVGGDTYKDKKNNARDLAIDYQLNFGGLSWSYGELYEIEYFFQKIGKRYGLMEEFHENGIC